MSDIDIKRLECDADYWDEVASEKDNYFDVEREFFFDDFRSWPGFEPRKAFFGTSSKPRVIARPTKKEWNGEGIPPIPHQNSDRRLNRSKYARVLKRVK